MDQKIYYRKVRDLGAIFSAAFTFIKQNFKTFYGSLLLFAGPFLLIGSAISSYTFTSMFNMAQMARSGGFFAMKDIIGAYVLMMAVIGIGVSIYNVMLNKNVIENESLPQGEPLTLKQVSSGFFGNYWWVFGNMLLLAVTVAFAFGFIIAVFAGIFALVAGGGGGAGGAILLGAFFVLLFIVSMVIFMPVLTFVSLAAMFVCQRDRINIFAAIGKVLHYLKRNFWPTWVVSFIGLLTYSVMAGVAQIPVLIITLVSAFSRVKSTVGYGVAEESTPVLLVVITSICTLLGYMVAAVYYLMNVYQYTSLEEKKEGSSILDKINEVS